MSTRTKRSSKRSVAAVIAAAVVASVLTIVAAPASAATPVTITTRSTLSGTDRYNTSEKVHTAAAAKNGSFTDLVVASGDAFPDALSAIALARKEDAGILLLPSSGAMTAAAVAKATAATNIHIIGGTNALSSAVETKLKTTVAAGGAGKSALTVTRLSGTDRYATAAVVANTIGAAGVAKHDNKATAIIVSGENFADAVSASALVSGPTTQGATLAHPILLVQADSVPVSTEVALLNLGIKKVIIVGGESAVSAAVATTLGVGRTVLRVSGADRFATASAVADLAIKGVAAGGFGMNKREVYLAEMGAASGGADALSAGSLVSEDGGVLLGTSGGTLPAATSAWLTANPAGTTGLTVGIIGGTSVIPTATEASIKTAAGGSADALTATISNNRAGQTTVTVTFSEAITKASCGAGDLVVINSATGASVASSACTMTTVPSTALVGTTAVFTAGAALTGAFEVRLPKGVVSTADGRTNALTTATVALDVTKPVITVNPTINATGTAIKATFSEPVTQVAALANGTVVTVGGLAESGDKTVVTCLGATCAGSANIESIGDNTVFNSLTITNAAAYNAGTLLTFLAGKFEDLAGNTNAAASATLVLDAVVPTVIGVPVATQATGACAVYSLDNKVLYTAKTCGSTGNDLDMIWAAAAGNAATVEACSVSGEDLTVVFTTAANSANTTSTAATMVATWNGTAACAAVATASVVGGGGALTAAISAAAQANNAAPGAWTGGTDVVTVTTSFSEAIPATGAPAASIRWDGACGGTFVDATAAGTVISGSTVTTTHTLSASGTKFVSGTSCVDYTTAIKDVAGNALVADVDNIAGLG
ncbi:MAG: cell wall-binding repeat-containing protein [Acidimicrobiales bacterium]|nr:cell wall-binding repeat-containing protein [Acidimicrobiales bacterium]